MAQELSLAQVLHPGDHLGRELLAFHAGYGEDLPQFLLQPADPLLDHALHPRRERFPVQGRSLDPGPCSVLNQIAPLLHRTQQLDGKEGMSLRVLVQCPAESLVQSVGLALHKRVHKALLLLILDGGEVQPDVAKAPLEFCQHFLQGMAPSPAQGNLLRTVGADEEDSAALEPSPQVEQKVDGSCVGPLHIVQVQKQGVLAGYGAKYVPQLLKDLTLGQALRLLPLAIHSFAQRLQPPGPGGGNDLGPLQQCTSLDQGVQQMRSVAEQSLAGTWDGQPQPQGVLAIDRAGQPAAFHITGQHTDEIPERQIGIAHPRIGLTGACGSQQAGVLGDRSPGELIQQSRLSPAGTSRDKDYPAVTVQRLLEPAGQLVQLTLTSHKGRPLKGRRPRPVVEKGRDSGPAGGLDGRGLRRGCRRGQGIQSSPHLSR